MIPHFLSIISHTLKEVGITNNNMEYYISVNNDKRGPYSISELKARGISSETLVMADGTEQWIPAWQIEELRPIIKNQVPDYQDPQSTAQNTDNQDKTADAEATPVGKNNDSADELTGQPINDGQAQPTNGKGGQTNNEQKIDDFIEGEPVNNTNNFDNIPYQQGYVAGGPTVASDQGFSPSGNRGEEHKHHGGCLRNFLIGLIILAALTGIAIVTCPDTNAHKAALANVVATAVSEEVNGTDSAYDDNDVVGKMFRQISDSWTQKVIETAVDNLIHVDNHIVFSTGKVRLAGKEHTVSVGVFGHVFTVDKDDLKAAAEQYYSKAERDTKADLQKKAEKIINENVIDPAAQAIKQMINGAMNDLMQDMGMSDGSSSDEQQQEEENDSTGN